MLKITHICTCFTESRVVCCEITPVQFYHGYASVQQWVEELKTVTPFIPSQIQTYPLTWRWLQLCAFIDGISHKSLFCNFLLRNGFSFLYLKSVHMVPAIFLLYRCQRLLQLIICPSLGLFFKLSQYYLILQHFNSILYSCNICSLEFPWKDILALQC